MLNDPVTRWAIALDVLAGIVLAAGMLGLLASPVVQGTLLADHTMALALTVAGAAGWIVAAIMLAGRLISTHRRKP